MLDQLMEHWGSEFGSEELTPGDIAARASPDMRACLSKMLRGPVTPAGIAELLPRLGASRDGGLRFASRVNQGRKVWRVERAESITPEPEPERQQQQQPVVPELPPDATPGELLAANIMQALRRQHEALHIPFDREDPRINRLISDQINSSINAGIRAQEAVLAAKRDGSRMPSPRLLAAVARAEAMGEEDKRRAAAKAARMAAPDDDDDHHHA
jgi:hypothetical protein